MTRQPSSTASMSMPSAAIGLGGGLQKGNVRPMVIAISVILAVRLLVFR